MKLYCDKCKKLIITDADNCIVCLNNQLAKANAKIEDIKKRTILAKDINGWYKDQCDGALSCYTLCNDILRIIESEE